MSNDVFEDIEIYPPSASALGINAFNLPGCNVVGHRPAYAACLRRVEDRKSGRLSTQYADCSAAIGKGGCEAAKMQKEELREGRAIYFINRTKLLSFRQYQDEVNAARQPTFSPPSRQMRPAKARSPAPISKPTHFLDVESGTYADAINASLPDALTVVMEHMIAPPPVKAVPPEPIKPQPVSEKPVPAAPVKAGMSLIEMARAQLAAKAAL